MRRVLLALPLLVTAAPAAEVRPRPADRTGAPRLPALAPTREVKAVYAELVLPPRFGDDAVAPPALPFSAAALKPYAADVSIDEAFKDLEKYTFRVGVVRALDLVRKVTADPKAPAPVTRIDAPVTDKSKRLLIQQQDYAAVLAVELESAADELDSLGKLRAAEPKRWQANYDYTLAQLRLRTAAVHEYNKLLGDVRTETLPALPDGATAWRLVPSEKMRSRAEVRKLAEQAHQAFRTIAADHKGTPWEALAVRALAIRPGLAWEPVGK